MLRAGKGRGRLWPEKTYLCLHSAEAARGVLPSLEVSRCTAASLSSLAASTRRVSLPAAGAFPRACNKTVIPEPIDLLAEHWISRQKTRHGPRLGMAGVQCRGGSSFPGLAERGDA